jgi:hypothetical protein
MFGFGKKVTQPSAEPTDFNGRDFADNWSQAIRQVRDENLSQLRNFVDEEWDRAAANGDLRTVLVRYCGAVEGIDDGTTELFKPFHDLAARPELAASKELEKYTRFRELQHRLQIRAFLEAKLQLSLMAAGPQREEALKIAVRFLDPDVVV